MSTIDKLAIRGIRSFSPFDEEKIEFFRPLTMILGQNGAGKTTLIEALRTMTSGSLPPHTGGGKSFVHDPKVSNLPEVKASIKLKFNTVNGKPVFALRSFQLTNQKTKQTFKKLEQVLKARDDHGHEISINNNCADMDRQVPLLMGVSSAILENVIFCHQDEALWPFSDQANLKKIFDEIFDTARYTKLLEQLRKDAKESSKRSKEMKIQLDLMTKDYQVYAKMKREQVCYLKKKDELVSKMQQEKGAQAEMARWISEIEEKAQGIQEKEEQLRNKTYQLKHQRGVAQGLSDELALGGLSEDQILAEFQDSERLWNNFDLEAKKLRGRQSQKQGELEKSKINHAEIAAEVVDQESRMKANKNRFEELVEQREGLELQIGKCWNRTQICTSSLAGEIQSLENQKAQIEKEHQELVLKQRAAQREADHKMELEERSLDHCTRGLRAVEAKLQEFSSVKKSKTQLLEVTKELASVQAEIERKLELMMADFEIELENSLAERTYMKIGANHNLETTNEKAEELFDKIASISAENGSKEGRIMAVQKIVVEIARLQEDKEEIARRISRSQQQRSIVDIILYSDHSATLKLTGASGASSKKHQTGLIELDRESKKLGKLARKFEELRQTVNPQLASMEIKKVENIEPSKSRQDRSGNDQLPKHKNVIQSERKKAYQDIQDQIIHKQMSQEACSHVAEQLQKFQTLLEQKLTGEKDLDSGESSVEQDLQEIQKCIDKYVKLESNKKATIQTIQKLIKLTKEKTTCFLCKQETDKECLEQMEQNFNPDVKEHDRKIQGARRTLDDKLKSKLRRACGRHDGAEAMLKASEEVITTMISELFSSSAHAKTLDLPKIRQQCSQLENLEEQISLILTSYPNIENFDQNLLIETRGEIDSLSKGLTQLENQENQQENKIQKLKRKKLEIIDQLDSRKEGIRELKRQKYRIESKRKKLAITKSEEQMQTEMLKLNAEKANIESKIRTIRQKMKELRPNRSQSLHLLSEDEDEEAQEIEISKTRASEVTAKLDTMKGFSHRYAQLSSMLDKQQQKVNEDDETAGEIQNKNKLKETYERRIAELTKEISDLENQLQSQGQLEARRKELEQFKRRRQDIARLEDEVALLSAALVDQASIKAKQVDLNAQQQTLLTSYSENRGVLRHLSSRLDELHQSLNGSAYTQIERKMADLAIQYTLSKELVAHLTSKHDAIDAGLMQFHHTKMIEINRQLADFWKMTYKGNDIQCIEIKSDQDKGTASARLRSYNYRIVSRTHDETELDMKGRCSAGQRVLSSIIIRLSLAETFCQNCGILALDEPTTNLDADNIEGLAQALMEIIESRKKQASFQLVVITHDEQFVQLLGSAYTEFVWKVNKDSDSFSRIKKIPVKNIL